MMRKKNICFIWNIFFHITLGRVFPNSQIVHQMPYGHVVATSQAAPTIQLQHHPAELKVIQRTILKEI